MKHLSVVFVAALASACSNPIAPSWPYTSTHPDRAVSPSGHTTIRRADLPSVPSVITFDPTQLGHATVSNTSADPHTYLLVVWLQSSTDEVDAAHTIATVQPNQNADLTVGLSTSCGAKYQRDVYVDAKPQDRYTDSDLNNLAFYAPGQLWAEAPCDASVAVSPAPPVDVTCPVGDILVGGVCLPATPPDDYL